MVSLKWSIQLCIEQCIQYKRLHFVQKSMGLPVTGCTPDAVRTAIKIQSTFQRLRESCLLSEVTTRFHTLELLSCKLWFHLSCQHRIEIIVLQEN